MSWKSVLIWRTFPYTSSIFKSILSIHLKFCNLCNDKMNCPSSWVRSYFEDIYSKVKYTLNKLFSYLKIYKKKFIVIDRNTCENCPRLYENSVTNLKMLFSCTFLNLFLFGNVWNRQVFLFKNSVIERHFPSCNKYRRSFRKILSKLVFWTNF